MYEKESFEISNKKVTLKYSAGRILDHENYRWTQHLVIIYELCRTYNPIQLHSRRSTSPLLIPAYPVWRHPSQGLSRNAQAIFSRSLLLIEVSCA